MPADVEKHRKHRVHGLAWSDEKRVEAATADAMGLSATMIQAATGIAAGTIKKWRQEEWYQQLIAEIRDQEDREIDGHLTKLVNDSLKVIGDRLENGDYMWNSKENRFIRKPVYMKEANKVASELIQRRNLLRGKPTSISSKEQISDKLAALADRFAQFARQPRTIEGEVLDVATERNAAGPGNAPGSGNASEATSRRESSADPSNATGSEAETSPA